MNLDGMALLALTVRGAEARAMGRSENGKRKLCGCALRDHLGPQKQIITVFRFDPPHLLLLLSSSSGPVVGRENVAVW